MSKSISVCKNERLLWEILAKIERLRNIHRSWNRSDGLSGIKERANVLLPALLRVQCLYHFKSPYVEYILNIYLDGPNDSLKDQISSQ